MALLQLGLFVTPAIVPSPAQGAERIFVNYGPLEFSLPISALEVYAREGKINDELAAYANYLEPEQLEQLRLILLARLDISPVAIAQFLYSPQGEIILGRVGEIIQTKAGQPGFYAIRAALIKAAADPQGFSLLNVLQEFPTYGIRINSARSLEVLEDLSNLIQRTQRAIAAVERQSIAEAFAQEPEDLSPLRELRKSALEQFSDLPDLRERGSVNYVKRTLTLTDASRNRSFPVDLYLPQVPGQARLIIISHGLGSDRQTFAYLANHLASYGFAVAVPEHPGSSARQVRALFEGLASEVTPPQEFIDRPLDIKFMLDQLERSFGRQLNLQQVGALGQSFGGYTVLALAGAEINFERIQQNCQTINDSLNLSLLLQCRTRVLSPQDYELQDERIQAAIAINPIGSTIFGPSEFADIDEPVMLVAGSDDTVAPALPEQIIPFTWLTNPNKYLVLLEEGTHFSTLGQAETGVPLPTEAIGPDPEVAQRYVRALSLAFFQTYISGREEYQRYLSAFYARAISQDIMPLFLAESLTPRQLMVAPTEEPTEGEEEEESPND
jgi:predicted dienelactone hydrolase